MIGLYYKTVESCPLQSFINVLVYNDVKYLKRFGFVKNEALAEAWENIFDSYLKISNSQQYSILLRRLKDIALMRNKSVLALSLIRVLELRYNEKIIENLRLLGYRYKFDKNDFDSYFKDLLKIKKKIKSDLITLKEMESGAREKSRSEAKESDFDQILVELSRFQGYRIDKKVISVSEYVNILNNYKLKNSNKNGEQRKD